MKQMIIAALTAIGLFIAVPGYTQEIGTDEAPVVSSQPDHSEFMAYAQNNVVWMRWGRTTNDGIDHYVVEHSTDSSFFNPVHSVVAKSGLDPQKYYQDAIPYPQSAVNFYRLTTFLKDGSSFSSPAVRVEVDPRRTPVLAPSVLQHGFGTLRVLNRDYRNKLMIVDFFSSNGQLMKACEVNSSSFNVNTTAWQRGMYFYRITDENHALVDAGKILVE